MAAKAFFRQNPTTLVWEYGDFKSDGITPNIESTITHARSRWETINSVEHLTLRHSEDNGIFQPFDNIPITDVASDKEGTPYVDRAAFETATKDFFFKVVGSGISFVTTADGQYLPYMTDPNDSTIKTRIGVRSGNLVLDITLTATGFDGNESTDGGITGDWVNVTGS